MHTQNVLEENSSQSAAVIYCNSSQIFMIIFANQ